MKRYTALFGVLCLLSTAACEPERPTTDPTSTISSSDSQQSSSTEESSSSVYYFPDTGATKLTDTEPRGTLGSRYVEIPNSDIVIYENETYADIELLAAYIQLFDDVPDNVVTSRSLIKSNNDYIYTGGTFENREGILPDGYTYTEVDLRTGYTWSGTSLGNRGAHRLVYGTDRTGDVVFVFATFDHYANFSEYLAYWEGWGETYGESPGSSYELIPAETGEYIYLDADTMIFGWDFILYEEKSS